MTKLGTVALLAALGSLSACADAVVMQDPAAPAESTVRGDLKTGWIWRHGATMPLQVSYEERDGLAIWQGDIVIGKAGEVPATREALEARMRHPSGPRLGLGISPGSGRWPMGVIPYVVDPALANPSRVGNAIAHIESQWGYVDYAPRGTETDYVYITSAGNAGDCATMVGRTGGQQVLYLGSNCSTGNTIHELLHTAGMHHEQNRCDRDSYLTIKWANMRDPAEPYYAKACDGYDEYGAYDLGSIMHYGPYADSQNGQRTLEPKPLTTANLNKMGQRNGLSVTDRNTLAAMYPKPLGPTGVTVTYPGNVPTISWNAVSGASYYSVELLEKYEENDYERGYSTYEGSSVVGTTSGLSLQDGAHSYTGNWVCNMWSSSYGSGDTYYYYDVYTHYPNGFVSWNSRIEANVAPC